MQVEKRVQDVVEVTAVVEASFTHYCSRSLSQGLPYLTLGTAGLSACMLSVTWGKPCLNDISGLGAWRVEIAVLYESTVSSGVHYPEVWRVSVVVYSCVH